MNVRQLIGLGGDCQVAHQIGRVYPNRDKHFFDWLVVPLQTVTRLVHEKFDHFLDAADLSPHIVDGRLHNVCDKANNTYFLHDFRNFDAEEITNAQAKYHYLSGKMLRLLNEGDSKTFIRQWHVIDGSHKDEAARELLLKLRQYNPNHRLIYLHEEEQEPEVIESSYCSLFMKQTPGDWEGPAKVWDYVLTELADKGA